MLGRAASFGWAMARDLRNQDQAMLATSLAQMSIAAGFVLLALGCAPTPDQQVPVEGKIRYHGVPLSSGTIVFSPDPAHGGGEMASSPVRADGSYALRTGHTLGAVAGCYRVAVIAIVVPPPDSPGQSLAVPQSLIPVKYRDPEASGLTCEIQPGRSNSFNFNLE
jgi:hypothetical protein